TTTGLDPPALHDALPICYTLSGLLGAGAMGTVWSGFDEVLQRRVAVKELKVPPGVPEHEAAEARERIMREARALGGLSHPNIIRSEEHTSELQSRENLVC